MAELQLERISKVWRNGRHALQEVSFDVFDREAVFLLGPSGAGKTTTLRLIAGLEELTGGDIKIAGRSVAGLTPRHRNVAMVYDKHSLFPHLSVFDNLAYPLRVRRMPEKQMRARIGEIADVLQISELLQRMPGQLSGGQMQRVAIGRALVRDAAVFLLDEPIAHLDAQLRARLRVEFKRLQREFKATMLYVSHDQLEAMTMADRIVLLNDGVVEQIGAPQELFDTPLTRFAATFVGEPQMNLLPAQIVEQDGVLGLEVCSSIITIPKAWFAKSGLSQMRRRLILGVRPQHLHLATGDVVDRGTVLHGSVYAVELLGSRALFDIKLGDDIVRITSTTRQARSYPSTIGAPIAFVVDPSTLYLFDHETGVTLAQAHFARKDTIVGPLKAAQPAIP